MIPLFPITSAGVEEIIPPWILLNTVTFTSSSFTYIVTVDSTDGLPAGDTGRLIFQIQADTFTTDQQIFNINVDDSTTVFDFESDNEGFEQAPMTNVSLSNYLSAQVDDDDRTTLYNNLTFSSINTATSGNGLWLRDTNGTASSNTGISTSDFYIYFEASGSSTSSRLGGLARSPEFSVDSNPSITISLGRLGSGFTNSAGTYGRLEIWWKTSS